MIKNISKENLKSLGELFVKCVECSGDEKVFSATLEFTCYVGWFNFIIYDTRNERSVDLELCSGDNRRISEWIIRMMEILIEEKAKSDVLNAPENIAATKEKLKQERIARIKKTLIELEA